MSEIPRCEHVNKTMEQYFSVVLFTTLNRVGLFFEPVDEILKYQSHPNESYSAELSFFTAQGDSNF